MSIKPMRNHYSMENPASVYDEEALTALELAGRTTAKVNEVVNAQNKLATETEQHLNHQDQTIDQRLNEQDNRITVLNDETMPAKVVSEVQKNINNGNFDRAIDKYAGNLENRVDSLLGQVPAGSTSMDAEVIDARTPLEGDTHPNAGTAVRAVEEKVIDLRNRANGGYTCFNNAFSKVKYWASATVQLPECIAVSDNAITWFYDSSFYISDPGIAIPVKQVEGAKKIYVDLQLDYLTSAGQKFVLYLSKQIGVVSGEYTQVCDLKNGKNHLELDIPEEHPVNYIWIICHPGDNGYVDMYGKLSSIQVYTNTMTEKGFSGTTVDSHLLELKEDVEVLKSGDISDVIKAGLDGATTAWNISPASSLYNYVGNSNWCQWDNAGDNGITIPGLNVDTARMLRIAFNLTMTAPGNVDVYVSESNFMDGKSYQIGTVNGTGHYTLEVDPANISVYQGFDVQAVLFIAHHTATIAVHNVKIYHNRMEDAGINGNFVDAIIEMYNGTATVNTSTSTSILTAPNGLHYIRQVDNTGNLVTVPVEPKKALFIGNSLLTSFDGFGMAASAENKDYYYLVTQAIEGKRPGLVSAKMSGSDWEQMENIDDRTAWINSTLDNYLSADMDLVLIQLGDNINSADRFNGFDTYAVDLLRFIREKCPRARVAWAGVWYGVDKIPSIQNVCKSTGCEFINLYDLHTPANESALGNTWTDTSGNLNTITSSGVASHPGDAGMKAIANRILYALGIVDTETYYD